MCAELLLRTTGYISYRNKKKKRFVISLFGSGKIAIVKRLRDTIPSIDCTQYDVAARWDIALIDQIKSTFCERSTQDVHL